LIGDANPPKHVVFEFRMEKLQGFKGLLINDSKATWVPAIEVVDIYIIHMFYRARF
jgi:hypothetical protein